MPCLVYHFMLLFIVLSHANEQQASPWRVKALGNKHLHMGCEGFLNCSRTFLPVFVCLWETMVLAGRIWGKRTSLEKSEQRPFRSGLTPCGSSTVVRTYIACSEVVQRKRTILTPKGHLCSCCLPSVFSGCTSRWSDLKHRPGRLYELGAVSVECCSFSILLPSQPSVSKRLPLT